MTEIKIFKDLLDNRRRQVNLAFGERDERMMAHLHTFINKFEEESIQEAIKWVKEIDNNLKPYESTQGTMQKNKDVDFVVGNIATREWIKNFYNITEADLK